GTDYIRFGEALARGRGYISPFPPGYPVMIALTRWFDPDRVGAAALVSLLCGALLPWPVWWIARRAVGRGWAVAAALLGAVHPELARCSAVTMSESAYLLALYGGLAFFSSARELPGGLALGAAFAIRPEAILPAGALAIRDGLRALRRRIPAWRW